MIAASVHRQAASARLGVDLNGDRPWRLAITGATGWLGSALANMAVKAGLTADNGRLRLFGSTERTVTYADGGTARIEALSEAEPLTGDDWLVAHFAFLGKERTVGMAPADFAAANDAILNQVQVLLQRAQGARMIFASSGAAYGPDGGMARTLEENPYGYVKVRHEQALTNWCRSTGCPLIIPRVFNVGGPHGNKLELYAISSLVRSAMAGGPVVIQARKPVFRSYVHIEELMAVLVNLIVKASLDDTSVFDTGGREVVEMGDLAERICEHFGLGSTSIERAYDPSLPADWYVGSPRAYQVHLARAGLKATTLSDIIADTAADLAG